MARAVPGSKALALRSSEADSVTHHSRLSIGDKNQFLFARGVTKHLKEMRHVAVREVGDGW